MPKPTVPLEPLSEERMDAIWGGLMTSPVTRPGDDEVLHMIDMIRRQREIIEDLYCEIDELRETCK